MPDTLSPLQAMMRGMGLGGSDGISFQTKRALLQEGVLESPASTSTPVAPEGTPPPESGSATLSSPPVAPAAGIGGPSVDAATMERIKAQQRAQGQENLRRIMEQRARLIKTLPQ